MATRNDLAVIHTDANGRNYNQRDLDRREAEQFADRAQDVAAAIRIVAHNAAHLAADAENAGWNFNMDFAHGAHLLREAEEYFSTWDRTHATECGVVDRS